MGLDPASVPTELRYLLPLAERWGIGDDIERSQAVHEATHDERQHLIDAVAGAPELLWIWLVEQSHPPYTEAWASLTDLTHVYDLASVLNDR